MSGGTGGGTAGTTPVPPDLAGVLATATPGEFRVVAAHPAATFRIVMHNDFLTPRGRPYKWNEVAATLSRRAVGDERTGMARAHYQWDTVTARIGTPEAEQEPRPWRFATGQSFWSYLLNTRVIGAPPQTSPDAAVSADAGAAAASETTAGQGKPNLLVDISYPELPKSPAVDMLLMLSWDVVTMEMLVNSMWATAALRTPGRPAPLRRISGTWADLHFSAPNTNGVFRNAEMTAVWLGVGLRGERPVSIYRYQCLDCEISVRTGPIEQRGRSSYWGSIEVDLETGDLVAAEMTEMIVATLSGSSGETVPVQKRRLVSMQALDERYGEPQPTVATAATQPLPQIAEAAGLAAGVANYLAWQLKSLSHLPASVTPMFNMGLQSVIATDVAGALEQVRRLEADLIGWQDGDEAASARLRHDALGYRQLIEGLLAFGQMAVELAETMDAQQAAGLRALCVLSPEVQSYMTRLLAFVDQLAR